MPMAESSPPIVVGMRHTSSDDKHKDRLPTADAGVERERHAASRTRKQEDDREADEEDVQRDLVRRLLARSAPSTSEIMRSRNDSPGSAVDADDGGDRTAPSCHPSPTDRSPPSFADHRRRLPRDGRLVDGRDALDDDLAVARDDVIPSNRDDEVALDAELATLGTSASPRRTFTRRSGRRLAFAHLPQRLSACALPRPSATASAKLAKSTVNHSHSVVVCRLKPEAAP